MKKTLLIVVIILALIAALPVINLVRWNFQKKKPMNIILVDKTVPTLECENHKSFSWVLTNDRFVEKDSKTGYSYKKDYYGFFPQRPLRDHKYENHDYHLVDLINLADKNDAVYFADTYGVFFNDWYRGINKSRRSRKLYGGLNNNDYLLIKEMKDRNKLIIMEYNSFDYPTAQFEAYRTQEKLGVLSTGWSGKYFSSLDTTTHDFPVWMTAMYRKKYNKPWTFSKSGVVILNQKDIVVLEHGKELTDPFPHIITDSSWCRKYGLCAEVAFDNWFDIVDPLQSNVISSFILETTPQGDSLLSGNGLVKHFPAAIRTSASQNVYYLAGNFAYSELPIWTSRFKGIEKLEGILYSDKSDDPKRFFWFYYKPLISGIFNEYFAGMNNRQAGKLN